MKPRPFQWSPWGWPIAPAVLSALGLLSALIGDGLWDWVSWLALGLPVAVCCWFGLRRDTIGIRTDKP
jgi:xanthosine utilization system XapX-like protein